MLSNIDEYQKNLKSESQDKKSISVENVDKDNDSLIDESGEEEKEEQR